MNDKDPKESKSAKLYIPFIIEGILAIAAIILIIFAINDNQKKDKKTNNVNESSNQKEIDVSVNEIDTSLYDTRPTDYDLNELNNITLSECEALEKEGKMLKIELDDGSFVYVNNYKNKEYLNENISVSDNEIEEVINTEILPYFSDTVEADHEDVRVNDVVSITFTGSFNGEVRDNMSGSDDNLVVGQYQYITDFEDGIIGMKVGETKDVIAVFPEEYGNEELAGNEAVFTITVNELKGTSTPATELTDDMIKEVYSGYEDGFSTVSEYKDYIRSSLQAEKTDSFMFETYYVDSIDETIVDNFYKEIIAYYVKMCEYQGLTFQDLVASSGMSTEEFNETNQLESCRSARYVKLFQALAKEENITLNDDDYTEYLTNNGFSSREEYKDTMGSDLNLEYYVLQYKLILELSNIIGIQ